MEISRNAPPTKISSLSKSSTITLTNISGFLWDIVTCAAVMPGTSNTEPLLRFTSSKLTCFVRSFSSSLIGHCTNCLPDSPSNILLGIDCEM